MTYDEKQAVKTSCEVIKENLGDIQKAISSGDQIAIKINTENIRTWVDRILDVVSGR